MKVEALHFHTSHLIPRLFGRHGETVTVAVLEYSPFGPALS
jgi:hypothetical protein